MLHYAVPGKGPNTLAINNPYVVPVSPKNFSTNKQFADEYCRLFMELLDAEEVYNKEYGVKDAGEVTKKGILSTAETAVEIYMLLSDNGTVIGMATVKKSMYEGCWFLSPIVIDKRVRGKGMGRFLLDDVLKRYPKGQMLLRVHADNPAALALYRSLGFSEMSFTMIRDPKKVR